jgi:hypothetical protein
VTSSRQHFVDGDALIAKQNVMCLLTNQASLINSCCSDVPSLNLLCSLALFTMDGKLYCRGNERMSISPFGDWTL